jgi:transposase
MKLKYCKLKPKAIESLLEHFCAGTPARCASNFADVNRHTAQKFYHHLRQIVALNLAKNSLVLTGEIEADESYFGGPRKGKRGRGAAGKVAVFGLLKRKGRVYTVVIPDAKRTTLVPIIQENVEIDSIVYTDTLRSYDTLDVSGFYHERVNHSQEYVSHSGVHINGIENFWSQAKRHLRKYNGIPKDNFHLFLKECEWRFNGNSPKELLKELRVWVKRDYALFVGQKNQSTSVGSVKGARTAARPSALDTPY